MRGREKLRASSKSVSREHCRRHGDLDGGTTLPLAARPDLGVKGVASVITPPPGGIITRVKLIDRYRGWNRLAYLSSFEKGLNRSLWALLAVAVGYAATHHIWLVTLPAFVSWGPPFGAVCYDLAIAYTGAFTFYILNIRLPLRRDRRNIYRTVGPLVGLVVRHGNDLITALNKAADIVPPDRENTWENIKEMCSKIGPNSQAEVCSSGRKA